MSYLSKFDKNFTASAFGTSIGDDPIQITKQSLPAEKQSPWAIMQCCLRHPTLAILVEFRLLTDKDTQIDRRTDRHTHRQRAKVYTARS